MWHFTRTVDLNPPLSYFLTRIVLTVLPVNPFTCRLLSLISFLAASFFIYCFLRRKTAVLFAASGVLIFWSSSFLFYASEARPYALMLAFTSLMVLSWDSAISSSGRALSPILLFLAGCGLLLTHVLGLFAFAAFVLAELMRTAVKRKIDWPVWAALALPGICLITYLPLVRSQDAGAFPPSFQATSATAVMFYVRLLYSVVLPLVIVGAVALVWPWIRKPDSNQQRPSLGLPHTALFLALLAVPISLVITFVRSGGSWFDRYGIVSLIPLVILVAILFARRTRLSRGASGTAVALLIALFTCNILTTFQTRRALQVKILSELLPPQLAGRAMALTLGPLVLGNVTRRSVPTPAYLKPGQDLPLVADVVSFQPKLPLVAASGLTFLEMDNREDAALTSRLYYLTDRQSAVAIAHATIFEGFGELKHVFPIRASVVPYHDFLATHGHFLVIGTYGYPEDWLLRKLEMDGAQMHP